MGSARINLSLSQSATMNCDKCQQYFTPSKCYTCMRFHWARERNHLLGRNEQTGLVTTQACVQIVQPSIRELPRVVVESRVVPHLRRGSPLWWQAADPEVEEYNRSHFMPNSLRIEVNTISGHRVVRIVPRRF
ncbi:uncharacterized protein LOC113004538 [Solenopsis invicta]|uniref:uncharacterized protein LOC113004538 n=1 Tax=Solenopsis invicta TaxID=13686 RepID=UPI0005959956|nr:uncharacterized protein LOC113004538 [Solenopsis invicta]XP_039306508.1 uncharacterized protein LOC113004538 [Solenopsis invicta]